jgi:hypothetical protein
MELENMKLARLRKPKAACFLSYVEYRPNTAVLGKTSHSHVRERG